MKNTIKLRTKVATALGIGAAAAVGCSVCCLPLVAPLLLSGFASAGIYRYGDVLPGWGLGLAGIAALSLLAFWIAKRRPLRRAGVLGAESCACEASCRR